MEETWIQRNLLQGSLKFEQGNNYMKHPTYMVLSIIKVVIYIVATQAMEDTKICTWKWFMGFTFMGKRKTIVLPNNAKCNIIALIKNHINNGWAKHLDLSLVFLWRKW